MGVGIGRGSSARYPGSLNSSSIYPPRAKQTRQTGNPDPAKYTIVDSLQIGKFLILELKYPDCNNYEGRKIMVYEATLDELLAQKLIDPHFSDHQDYKSPIARFEPTKRGWCMAIMFIKNWMDK